MTQGIIYKCSKAGGIVTINGNDYSENFLNIVTVGNDIEIKDVENKAVARLTQYQDYRDAAGVALGASAAATRIALQAIIF